MSEGQLAATAAAMWGGALIAPRFASWGLAIVLFACLVAALAWWSERAVVVMAALVLLAGAHAGVAWQRLERPIETASYAGSFQLESDPASTRGGVRVRAEVDGAVYDLRAWGSPAGWVRSRLVGEHLVGEVRIRPLDTDAPRWLRAQGVVGRGTVTSVERFVEGPVHTRLANSLRRTIEAGAESLNADDRSLFTGLVYGDDRRQSPLVADDFAAAGLTHLLAVSGQNVAFVLALGGPLLRRLGHRRRLACVAGLLLVFATMTRFEASVVRASVMASISAVGALVGTAVPARRVLALTVIALLALDPLLVHSVAFQLSLAASAGILFWSGRVARAVPGPRPLIEAIAVTASAQLAVAPLLLWRFGGLPVASLPANVLAGPAAGPAMMWGMTAGVIAGLGPAWMATVLHLPTRLLVAWIGGVAAWSARLPLGELGFAHIASLAIGGWLGLRSTAATARRAALLAVTVVLLLPSLDRWLETPSSQSITGGVVFQDRWTTVVYLADANRPEQTLADIRRAGVSEIDLVAVRAASFASADLVGWLDRRHDIGQVWAPATSLGHGELVPRHGTRFTVAGEPVVVEIEGIELVLRSDG